MKRLTITLIWVGLLFGACEKSQDEPLEENQQAEVLEELWLQIQADLPRFAFESGRIGSQLTRVDYMFSSYEVSFPTSQSSRNPILTTWNSAYQRLLPNLVTAIDVATEENEGNYLGVAKIVTSYVLLNLVDNYGEVPYSDLASANPVLDSGEDLYALSLQYLDEAIGHFNTGADLGSDFYYNSDYSQWIKLANTLKMQIYLNTRLIDLQSIDNFKSIVLSGNFISETTDDFQYRYGNGLANADPVHPAYDRNYKEIGPGWYMSNWLMDKMLDWNDPRSRTYFYRQIECTPGGSNSNGDACPPDEPRLSCSMDDRPNHFPNNMTFCWVNNGYWGRDHGDSGGIPPDGLRRSTVGVYPSGGKFDGDDFTPVTANIGGNGLGVMPMLLSSQVDMMRMEIALVENDNGSASNLLEQALQKSIDKAISFISLDPDANADFIPTSTDINTFITNVSDEFNNSNNAERWNLLAEQTLISYYGNGTGAYNFYRRTGFPVDVQFHLDAGVGPFVRSVYYPEIVVNSNSNIDQKPNTTIQVFWDNNPASPGFPVAN